MPRLEPQIRFCRAVTQLRQIDENAIYKLFDLIQAPNNLLSFFHLIPLLPDIFKTAIEITAIDGLADKQYQNAGKTANNLNSLLPDLQNNPRLRDFHTPVPMSRFGPCYGILLTHPLYSALAENVPHRDYYGSLVYLKAHIFLAVESLGHIDQKLLEELRDPFICFRKLTRPKNWPYLGRLPNQPVPASSFAQIFRLKFHGTPFQPIGKIFQLAEKTFHKRKRTQGTSSKQKVIVPRRSREDDEDPTLDYVQDIQPSTTLTQLESEDYLVHGGLPEELGGDVDLEPVLAGDKYHGPTRRQLVFQAKQASNRRAMENQFCALAWNQANLCDLKIFFGFLDGDHQLEGFDFQPLSREEAVVVLGLMFYTCNPLERILSFPVFNGIKPILNSPEGLYLEENRATIRLHSPGPELTDRVTRQPGTFPVEQHVNLPLPECFSRCLEKSGNPLPRGKVRPRLIGNINPNDVTCVNDTDSVLRRILRELNKDGGTRLSLGRVSSYMLFRLAEADKCDLPGSMLFFGRNDKIARTRIHYTLAAVDHLETAYRNCINNLLDNVGHPGQFIFDEAGYSGSYLGTPFCPTPGTVKKLSMELQAAVSSTIRSTLADRHNLYALYTSLLISFGTGFRAIHDPSFKEIEIDFDWGIGIISDKGNASYRSRYVYLSPVVLEQIRYYRQHLQVLYGQLGVINPSLFDMVKTLDYEGLPLNLFWLRGDLDPVELLTPGVARMILARNHQYTIPLNAGRHYLKYRLIQRGCSPELVEAQLGHWENGQEPWGLFSNLDPLDFAGQMAGHLPKILKEDGWRAIRGLG